MLLALIWFVGFASVAARLPAQECKSIYFHKHTHIYTGLIL